MADPPIHGARLLVPAAEVECAWSRLAAGLQPLVHAGDCVLIGVMVGGMIPLVEIARRLEGDFVLDYCHLTRYGDSTTGGDIRWISRPRQPLRGRVAVLVDDIFDAGHTLAELQRHCRAAGARQVVSAVLARKRHPRPVVSTVPEHIGLEIGDEFVFGCGMDLQERWRQLRGIYALADPAGDGPGR
ncbi:hypoxanthine phosphoribosyltransferase [Gammaproteobacteria bacterium]|nr:hypoxanthine-guanine phosphoribosyltransferase [Gammaproteobacteria bacterium]CAG0942976.1 hypoxanthine phosphoribosyltransferase [Gammaproteobacteria bacterium]